MSLSNALFSGLSGIDVNQTKLNVVGNNIANANTVAFKATRVLFKPQIYATDSAGSPPTNDSGGTNPQQRGTGATIAASTATSSPGPSKSRARTRTSRSAATASSWFAPTKSSIPATAPSIAIRATTSSPAAATTSRGTASI